MDIVGATGVRVEGRIVGGKAFVRGRTGVVCTVGVTVLQEEFDMTSIIIKRICFLNCMMIFSV